MLKHAAATEGGTYTPETGARTWIWSDLHLHHKNIIRYCSRPFRSVEAMNEALLAAWKETVSEADTIICGGDIALAGALQRERLARVRAMPGRKLLVRGNHDFGSNGRPTNLARMQGVVVPLQPQRVEPAPQFCNAPCVVLQCLHRHRAQGAIGPLRTRRHAPNPGGLGATDSTYPVGPGFSDSAQRHGPPRLPAASADGRPPRAMERAGLRQLAHRVSLQRWRGS